MWLLLADNNENPFLKLNSKSSCNTLEFNRKYSNVIGGGLQNGQVCVWDIRTTADPQILTNTESSHRGCVNCVRQLDENVHILSGSSNGEVFWWDIRNISKPLCDFKIDSNASKFDKENPSTEIGCTSLECDKRKPGQILIGTSDGTVIFANKKDGGKLDLSYSIQCHSGPVSSLGQNWASFKCILTVENSEIKIWNEDCKNDAIFSVSSVENEFSCGGWSPTRFAWWHNWFGTVLYDCFYKDIQDSLLAQWMDQFNFGTPRFITISHIFLWR